MGGTVGNLQASPCSYTVRAAARTRILLQRHWFAVALGIVILLAWLAPGPAADGGILRAAHFRTVCIAGIFFASGLSLPTRALGQSLGHWRLHLFIQGFSLGFIPLCFMALDPLLGWAGMDEIQRSGFLVLACVPTTVTSCVVMTRMANGNEAGALCNAALGNLLGVFVTPALLFLLLGRQGVVGYGEVIRKLGLLVVTPVLLGQAVQWAAPAWLPARRRLVGRLPQWLLLGLLYVVFARSFTEGSSLPARTLAGVASVALISHIAFLGCAWTASAWRGWRFTQADRRAAAICGAQKTVALGIPLLSLMYEGDPAVGLLAVPLLTYHFLQLLVDGTLAGRSTPDTGTG